MARSPRFRGTGAALMALSFLVAGAFALAGSQPPAGQAASGQQRPTFRTAANFVQVDVYPSANGRPVADLSKEEFEVLEDGLPQAVATFEHVSVRSASPGTPRVEPRLRAYSIGRARRWPFRSPWWCATRTGSGPPSRTRTLPPWRPVTIW